MPLPSVLHISPAIFHPTLGVVGGAERYAFELAKAMADRTRTTLVGFGKTAASFTADRLDVQVLGDSHFVRGQWANPISAGLLPLIADHDIVHCHQKHILVSSLVALLGRLVRKPVFVHDHGGGGWDISAYINTDKWYRGEFHGSQFSRRSIGHENHPNDHVIYGGVDTNKFSPANFRNALVDRPIVYVGRLLPHKGIDYLIRALPDGMKLRIVGRATNPEYLGYLRSLACNKAVSFVLDASDSDIVQAYRSSLCVVLPSVYRSYNGQFSAVPELLGQTLLEGMACGTPGIATDVASLPEVVEDNVSGFLVQPNDPLTLGERLRWLGEHPQDAAVMGDAARKRVLLKFTWPTIVQRCLDIYRT